MGGRESLRGYLVQTMSALLGALDDNAWEAVSLEPVHESEKVDVKWQYPDHIRVVQIKSSQNAFKQHQIKRWCKELTSSTQADQYELQLVGTIASTSNDSLENCEGVQVPTPIPLYLEGMIKGIAHDLGVYCDKWSLPRPQAQAWRILASALTFQLEVESISGRWLTRDAFDKLLQNWILSLLPKIKEVQPDVSFDTIREAVFGQSFEPEPWIQPLEVCKVGHSSNKSVSLPRILRKDKKIILLGSSGSGKTYLIRTTAIELNNDPDYLCFWIPLVFYTSNLDRTIRRWLGWYSLEDDAVIPTLEKHRATLLLDGLNEVPERHREQCTSEIQQLLHTYQGEICISYPLSDHAIFGFACPAYQILPLTKEQIKQAIQTFFNTIGELDKASWFLKAVRGWQPEQQRDFDSLAQTPIHLQFILELVTTNDFYYSGLRDLYGQVIQKRLEKTRRHDQRGTVPVDAKIQLLLDLAYRSISEGHPLQMQKSFVQSVFNENLTLLEATLTYEEIVRASLLIEANEFLVEWPHSSFRDYLAGRQLFTLAEMDQQFDTFPLEEPHGAAAAAHATRLATRESRRFEKRPAVFSALLDRQPSFEVMKAVAEEYHPAWEYYVSTYQDLEFDETEFRRIQWGKRFVHAFQQIAWAARRDEHPSVDQIPLPEGLKIFFDSGADFCAVTFSEEPGIYFDQLQNFESWISQAKKRAKTCFGFCLFAPFLLLLDPEIVAYLQFGVWLRLGQAETQTKWDEWHNGLATYVTTRNEWLSWGTPRPVPEPEFDLCASPQQTFLALQQRYGQEQAYHIVSLTDVGVRSSNEFLSWQEMYMPITFQIFPAKVKVQSQLVSNRLSQWMLLTPPGYDISLILLMPWSHKIDFGINIFLPFPTPSLNGYYFLEAASSSDFPRLSFVHLHGTTNKRGTTKP